MNAAANPTIMYSNSRNRRFLIGDESGCVIGLAMAGTILGHNPAMQIELTKFIVR
jgi:hypothetical protein